jgi:hypothetical protein
MCTTKGIFINLTNYAKKRRRKGDDSFNLQDIKSKDQNHYYYYYYYYFFFPFSVRYNFDRYN